jgi:hypothetical protein
LLERLAYVLAFGLKKMIGDLTKWTGQHTDLQWRSAQ